MNLNSEIAFYQELRPVDKARLLNLFLHELAQEARGTYGAGEQVHDGVHLRFVNELYHRLTRVIEQLLGRRPRVPRTMWCCGCCSRRAPTRWPSGWYSTLMAARSRASRATIRRC